MIDYAMFTEEGNVMVNGHKISVKCYFEKFDFSAHAGLNELKSLAKKINPKNIIFNHGDKESILNMAKWARNNLKCKVFTPQMDKVIDIR